MSVAARRSHRGDEYQLAVATYWVAQLLWDENMEAVRVDPVARPGEGELIHVDDIVISYHDGRWRFIQAKKNQTGHSAWLLTDPVLRKELCKARDQLETTPAGCVELCSRTPFGELAKLIEDGADYPDHTAFAANAPATLKAPLAQLAGIIDRDEADALALVRRIDIGPHHDFGGWEEQTRSLLEARVTNPETALDVIARLVRSQQSGLKTSSDALRHTDLLATLADRGVFPIAESTLDEAAEEFAAISQIGRQWRRTIGGESIPRPELQQLIGWADTMEAVSVLLTDGPGTGKTCLLLDFADHVEQRTDWSLLFIKGDLFARCGSDAELTAAGLPKDPVSKVAHLTRHRRVVVIDSLDVLSLHREHRSLRLFLTLMDRLERLPNVCVVTACRTFDLRYDPLLRERNWDQSLTLQPLDFETIVLPLLERQGIASEGFSPELKSLLTVPENLRLLVDSAVGGAAPADIRILTTANQLQALYLEEVVRRDPLLGDPAMMALQALASRMMQERAVALPRSAVATDDQRLQRLISQGVLVEPRATGTGQAIGFGHQTLLDALAVRAALALGQTLADFILDHPPFPFLRPAVRGFAKHLRETDSAAFRRQIRAAMGEARIAYHLKRVLIESLAEMVPTDEDWPLVRHLWQKHPDLFRRLLWQARHDDWFRLLRQHWWPALSDNLADDPLRTDFVLGLGRWTNRSPAEVVELWRDVISSKWGGRLQLEWQIEMRLDDFLCWGTQGVYELLETLAGGPQEEHDCLLKPLSRFVEATGRGEELLWRHICRDVNFEQPYRIWHALHCSPHDFHRQDFLQNHLSRSDGFLDLVIATIQSWSERESAAYESRTLHVGLLSHTAWNRTHSHHDHYDADDIDFLIHALSQALRRRARDRTDWWRCNEPRLRTHTDLGVRYLLILAYLEDKKGNAEGIAAQLLDKALHQSDSLRYELTALANACYPLLTPVVQESHQALLIGLFDRLDYNPQDTWCLERVYQALSLIPAPFRSEYSQAFINRWRPCFGIIPAAPDIYSSGGMVRPPVDLQRLLSLSEQALRRLLRWYSDREVGWAEIHGEGLVGGSDSLLNVIESASACAPHRFLDQVPRLVVEGFIPDFTRSIVRGAASHLMYRFGKLQPPSNSWNPEEPLPDGPSLGERILGLAERFSELWQKERTAARVLQGCSVAVEEPDAVNRLVWLLLRLACAQLPTEERVRFDPDKREEPASKDLVTDAINEPRGIAATAAIGLANRLSETTDAWPELLEPLLKRLASDPVASVRAGILRGLPYLMQKQPEVGWDLLDRCLINPHQALWELAGETLYYQLRNRFDQVAPYLDRMLDEAPDQADDTWSRLSTLALLEGHVDEDDLFRTLETLERPALWKGAASVFAANIGQTELAPICRRGILRILDCTQTENIIVALECRLVESIGFHEKDRDLVEKLIESIRPSFKRHNFLDLPDWLAAAARRDPMATLPLLELLAAKLDGSLNRGSLFHTEPLITAMLEILREADESDDPKLISRTIALQDRYLSLGLSGMEEMLEKATVR